MADATYNALTVDFECEKYKFKTTGKSLIFEGYTALYNNQPVDDESDESSAKLPNIEKGDKFIQKEVKPEQKWTKPPARYTEASLVKAMEEKGIGRPSTYTQSVTTLFNRTYVEKDGKAIKPTELGNIVVDMLIKFFPNIMDIKFTAEMEDSLDDIEYAGKDWHKVLEEFYYDFDACVKVAMSDGTKAKIPDEPTDEICEKCGSKMVIRQGRFGKFLACPNYPACKNTKPLEDSKRVVAKCPKCGKDVLERKSKRGKVFYSCSSYPECDYSAWNIPANENCPNCGQEMIVKLYKNMKVISCDKCNYSRREKIEKKVNSTSEEMNQMDEIEILNKLDEQNG